MEKNPPTLVLRPNPREWLKNKDVLNAGFNIKRRIYDQVTDPDNQIT